MSIVVTGATGQLGHLVVTALLRHQPAEQIVAAVRSPGKASELAALGVDVRAADYGKPGQLREAFDGADRLLLISSSEVGRRVPQHAAVIEAAKAAGVRLLVYTSVLHADNSPLGLAAEHVQTEALLADSGLPHVVLRNGWYVENYTGSAALAIEHAAVLGSSGKGLISAATRADYAEAAAQVLLNEGHAGKVYELAADDAFDMESYAAELARQAGKPVAYVDLPEAEYKAALVAAGLPEPVAALIADSSAAAAQGALFDQGRQLSGLIGRPTTPWAQAVRQALRA